MPGLRVLRLLRDGQLHLCRVHLLLLHGRLLHGEVTRAGIRPGRTPRPGRGLRGAQPSASPAEQSTVSSTSAEESRPGPSAA